MGSLVVAGNARISGSYRVSGNKNEAFPAISAALLCGEEVRLSNVPDIGDVRSMLRIASDLGADVSPLEDNTVTIHAKTLRTSALAPKLSSSNRGSVVLASALLVRTGNAVVPQPGGDKIGRRRLDTHFRVFEALGARVSMERNAQQGGVTLFNIDAGKGLTGTEIFLDEASVTATENAVIAASGARGKTVIENVASEPHVQGLCRMLVDMGVRIEGIGSNVLTVHGVQHYKPVHHELGSDHIEAGSIVGLAAATGSELTVTHVDTRPMRMALYQFERLGVRTMVDEASRTIHVPSGQVLRVRRDLGNAIPQIHTGPWPAFPADLMPIALVTATQSEGTCLIHEKMFESRLYFVDWLLTMGAQVVLCDPHRAVVSGPSQLYGATVSSPDIRAGMTLLIAALAAEGPSTIHNVEQIDRGYERIDERLNALGAGIERVTDRRAK
jgi:UDP-N-acetylglucosamine 1-carboxyvinyltransferase